MNDLAELIRLVDPPARRMWLLVNALRSLPFDRAIALARTAEAFVTGSFAHTPADTHVNSDPSPIQDPECTSATDRLSSAPQAVEEAPHRRSPISIKRADRDRRLGRLAAGAKNIELAAEFGLSPRQVQGIQMGCAREIETRREQLSSKVAPSAQILVPAASIEEVVRYLRQQDDVIVAQENGGFLVNGRFLMPWPSLSPAPIGCEPAKASRHSNWRGAPRSGETKYPLRMAIRYSGTSPPRLSAFALLCIRGRDRVLLKARSSSVEHCQHMAEVGGSIPSRAYHPRSIRPNLDRTRSAPLLRRQRQTPVDASRV